jgi:hypothetical protein
MRANPKNKALFPIVFAFCVLGPLAYSCSGEDDGQIENDESENQTDDDDASGDADSDADGDVDTDADSDTDSDADADADSDSDGDSDGDTDSDSDSDTDTGCLDFERFKNTIKTLSDFGDRTQGSQSYEDADQWLEQQLQDAGYVVERQPYEYNGSPRSVMFVTKIGASMPDRMYMVSAHLDGRSGGGAADDDASGVSVVLEAAYCFAEPDLETGMSARFIFWNNEETGFQGAKAYKNDREALQGIEDPPGSGLYPEPTWLGIIQHDMVLYDHGVPPEDDQIAEADIDVSYQKNSGAADEALAFAEILQQGAVTYADYPAEIGDNMYNTDSVPFEDIIPAVSVRENRRDNEIGNGSNPYYHTAQDLYDNYSEDDYALGFSAAQMTVGTLKELVNP